MIEEGYEALNYKKSKSLVAINLAATLHTL